MNKLQFTLVVLLVVGSFNSTYSMGVCKFTRKFPCNEKDCPLSAKLAGCMKKQFLNKTQANMEPTSEQSTISHLTNASVFSHEGSPPFSTAIQLTPNSETPSAESFNTTTITQGSQRDMEPTTWQSTTTSHSTNEPLNTNKELPTSLTTNQSTPNSVTLSEDSFDSTNTKQGSDGHATTELQIFTTPPCPPNMVYANCTKGQGTCENPWGDNKSCMEPETCICVDGYLMKGYECVPQEECGCFKGVGVIRAGGIYVNQNCSEKCTCKEDAFNCTSTYNCSVHASCRLDQGMGKCYCNEGYGGDGETCTRLTDCHDVHQAGYNQSGVYTILPTGWHGSPFNVSCDMASSEGWTIFQRRIDGLTNFYRNWTEYKHGFGSIQGGHDFWLGNEQLHYLTNQKNYKLRIDMVDSGGKSHYGEYTTFIIKDESLKYRLRIANHLGDTGDGMVGTDEAAFSTHDQDNDGCGLHDCAEGHKGGWWYKPQSNWCVNCYTANSLCEYFQTGPGCNTLCTSSNLNGNYNGDNGQGIFWMFRSFCKLNSVEMKILPSSG